MVVVCALLFRSSELYRVSKSGGVVRAKHRRFYGPPSLLAISIEPIEAQKRKRASRIAGVACNRSPLDQLLGWIPPSPIRKARIKPLKVPRDG
jgi:hypothetical protein